MDVANNLNIESLQDSNSYDSKSGSASLSGTAGATGVSASVSVSGTKMKSRFASVNEQSGISAGSGGYDITVGNNTDLKGAVIASTATDTASNNLDTGTISFSEVKNSGYYDVDSMSFSASMSTSSLMPTVSAPSAYHNGDDKSSTTQSAIANGNLTVRNKDAQKQAVDTLSHDTANANSQLQAFFDKDKEQDRMDTVQMVKDVATQVKTVGTKLDRLTAQKEVDKKGISEDAYNAAKNTLGANATEKQIKALAYSNAVDTAVIDATKNGNNIAGIGSGFNKAVDSGASLVTGAITGDIVGGIAGASAPYLATAIKNATGHYDKATDSWKTDEKGANYALHGLLGAGVAALQGNSALAGAAGAAGGEYAANTIKDNFYDGKDTKDLTESEKQDISNWSQIASGAAAFAGSGGNMGDASTAISASKNAVENNNLVARAGWYIIRPSIIGAPVTITAESVLIGKGLTQTEAQNFLNNLSLEQRNLISLALVDPVGNENLESAVIKTFDKYYDASQLAKKLKESADSKTSTKVTSSSTSSVGAPLPPDDDDDKHQSSVSKNKDKQQQSNDFVNYKGKLEKGDQIDLEKFTKRITVSKRKGEYVDPKTGWRISPERSSTNPHGGSVWKLMDKAGNKIGTLSDKGVFLR